MNQRGRYILRIVLGGYLAFIGGNLTWEMWTEKPSDMAFKMFMGIVFLVIGVGYTIWSIKNVVGELKTDLDKQQKEADAQEAARKLEEKHKRDQMKFRTAPMPAPSEIVKGMVTIKEESGADSKAEKRDENSKSSEAEELADVREKEAAEQLNAEKEPGERLNTEKEAENTDTEEEQDFEEV